jgi:hypothetical protein
MFDERDQNAIDPPDNTGGTDKANTDSSSSDEEANAIDPPDNTGGGTKS